MATPVFGEVVAFLFFGPVAVFGTTYVQISAVFDDDTHRFGHRRWSARWRSGSWQPPCLLVNNLRDVSTDAPAGKKTLSVRFGVVVFEDSVQLCSSSRLLAGVWAALPVLVPANDFCVRRSS